MFRKKLRIALTAAALCGAAATANAKPRRVVILDFDGPRTLADTGRNAVMTLLGDQYELATKKKWIEARSRAGKNAYGPQTWSKAAKASGIDAVIEGWVQDEGRNKVLNIVVREASTGREFDTLTFKFGKKGLSDETLGLVRTGLEDVLDYIEPGIEPSGRRLPEVDPKRALQSKKKDVEEAAPVNDEIEIETEPAETKVEKKQDKDKTEVATAPIDEDRRDQTDFVKLFGPDETDRWPMPKKPNHVPKPTPRFQIGLGGYISSRSLELEAEDAQNFLGVETKGLSVTGAVYPFPYKKTDGQMSGIGFAVSLYTAPQSVVTNQGEDEVGDYKISESGWDASVHYRQPLGDIVHIDGHVGYHQDVFGLESDIELDVPDTAYKYFWGGFNVDLSITDRATVGFGARYLYVTDNGAMSDLDWYGPGSASGYAIDGNFLIPLPARLFVQGEVKFRKITTEFDAPDLSAEEARNAKDSTVTGNVHVGIQF
jgi:hypothetical protein